MGSTWSRREFLKKHTELIATLLPSLALGGIAPLVHGASRRISNLSDDPFTLGVASGDPTPDAVVLWTRLSKKILRENGIADQAIQVDYELSESPNFQKINRSGIKNSTTIKKSKSVFVAKPYKNITAPLLKMIPSTKPIQ